MQPWQTADHGRAVSSSRPTTTITGTVRDHAVVPTVVYSTRQLDGTQLTVLSEGGQSCRPDGAPDGVALVVAFECGLAAAEYAIAAQHTRTFTAAFAGDDVLDGKFDTTLCEPK